MVEPQNIAFTWRCITSKTNPLMVLLLNCSMVTLLRFLMLFMAIEEKAYCKGPKSFQKTLVFRTAPHLETALCRPPGLFRNALQYDFLPCNSSFAGSAIMWQHQKYGRLCHIFNINEMAIPWLYGLDEPQHQSARLSHPRVHQELQQKVSPALTQNHRYLHATDQIWAFYSEFSPLSGVSRLKSYCSASDLLQPL
jgi:hypothetical protein